MKQGVILFFIQVGLTLIAAFNMRCIAQANYFWVGLTDFLIALLSFLAVTKIAIKSNKVSKYIGFTLGSVIGSLLGVYLSKIVLRQ